MFPVKQNLSFLKEMRPNLEKFSEFLLKWQKSVNLISPNTIPYLWERHIVDSAQLYSFIPDSARLLLDMGSGAGFPGVILAMVNQHLGGPLKTIVLVESDNKKCIFLNEVVRMFQLPVRVLNKRMEVVTSEDLNGKVVDVLTARALAPVPVLLKLSQHIRTPETMCLFLKGEQVDKEISEFYSQPNWEVCSYPSISDSKGVVIQMRGVMNE